VLLFEPGIGALPDSKAETNPTTVEDLPVPGGPWINDRFSRHEPLKRSAIDCSWYGLFVFLRLCQISSGSEAGRFGFGCSDEGACLDVICEVKIAF
jgi:hypothetical protein